MSQFITNLDIYMLLKASGNMKNSALLYDTLLNRINVEVSVEDLRVLKNFTKTYIRDGHRRTDTRQIFSIRTWNGCIWISRGHLLLLALVNKLKEHEKPKLAEIIDCLYKDNEKTENVHNYMFKKQLQKTLPQDEALALIIGLNLSKWRKILAEENTIALPSYSKIIEPKKSCYPGNIAITESGVRIKLQSILDLTVKKLNKLIGHHNLESPGPLKLISKWGCDGSSSHSNYKQKVSEEFSDSSVFMTSLVPLRLMAGDVIIWQNPRPSSTNYSRPVIFEFVKESKEYIQQHTAGMDEEIANLDPTKIDNFEISHDVHMTMIDGKITTALSETTSHANCNIFHATPKEMNNLNIISNKPVAEEMFFFWLGNHQITSPALGGAGGRVRLLLTKTHPCSLSCPCARGRGISFEQPAPLAVLKKCLNMDYLRCICG